jgi:hypothetical protein
MVINQRFRKNRKLYDLLNKYRQMKEVPEIVMVDKPESCMYAKPAYTRTYQLTWKLQQLALQRAERH